MRTRPCAPVAAASVLALSPTAAVAETFTAKLSLDVQKGNPKEVAAEQFADAVRKRTNGEVDINI